MSRAAQAVARAVKEMGDKKKVAKAAPKVTHLKAVKARTTKETKVMDEAKKPRAKKAKEPKEPKVRDPKAGIKSAPKLKALLLGAAISRETVSVALKAQLNGEVVTFTDAQRAEAERLQARLAARG